MRPRTVREIAESLVESRWDPVYRIHRATVAGVPVQFDQERHEAAIAQMRSRLALELEQIGPELAAALAERAGPKKGPERE